MKKKHITSRHQHPVCCRLLSGFAVWLLISFSAIAHDSIDDFLNMPLVMIDGRTGCST